MTTKYVPVDIIPTEIEFSAFTADEIKQISVVKVITGLTYDPLGYPLPGGLYDSAMGVYGRSLEPCTTCLKIQDCPGHMGHIELSALVYNPFFIHTITKLLGVFCLHCFKAQIKCELLEVIILQLKLVQAGLIVEAQELENYKWQITSQPEVTESDDKLAKYLNLLQGTNSSSNEWNTKTTCALRTAIVNLALQRPTGKKCIHCKQNLRNVKYTYKRLVYHVSVAELKEKETEKVRGGQNRVVLAEDCREYLRKIYADYSELLLLLFPVLKTHQQAKFPVDMFFLSTLPVTPPRSRPSNILRNQIVEHPQTAFYRNILENNNVLRAVMQKMQGQDELTQEAIVSTK